MVIMRSQTSLALLSIILIAITIQFDFTSATPIIWKPRSLISDLTPEQGSGIQGEITCYNLPYGGIGFLSHVLTYWTVGFLFAGRSPLPPWSELEHNGFNMITASISLCGTLSITIFTMVSCQNDWQFVLIAFWKLTMSITLSSVCIHRNLLMKDDYSPESEEPFYWLIFYACGVITGFTGLVSLVIQSWETQSVVLITEIFGGIAGFIAVICVFVSCSMYIDGQEFSESGYSYIQTVGGWVGILSALYCDWILGAIADNMIGAPSSDVAVLYWIYFVAKRLPLFSF
jgi:hypothetical protein